MNSHRRPSTCASPALPFTRWTCRSETAASGSPADVSGECSTPASSASTRTKASPDGARPAPSARTMFPAFAEGARAGMEVLSPLLIGKDPRDVGAINVLMDTEMYGIPYAKTGLDNACWDILGKSAGLPVSHAARRQAHRRLPVRRRVCDRLRPRHRRGYEEVPRRKVREAVRVQGERGPGNRH